DPSLGVVIDDPQGREIHLADFAHTIRVFDVWATWCGPCRMGIPHLNAIYDRFRDRGVVVIGLSVDDGPREVRDFQREVPMRYPNGMFNRQMAGLLGDPSVIPTTFLVDRQGRVVRRFRGFVDASTLERAILNLL
ncbi:MAG TPA: TlpA disulfide reductase family protein, partial [Candidatus Polarisedimenticolia bacterium]|nr:TlpA disulfide reductase family protein [Candidatus Polarisedimenticolia bacterium]